MILNNIYFGSIDAKHELSDNDLDSEKAFLEAFVIPPNIVPREYIEKKRFIIGGLKGTGKTALLRYLDLIIKQSHGLESEIILFNSDFDEKTKKEFIAEDNVTTLPEQVANHTNDSKDYQAAWLWFFYYLIAQKVIKSKAEIFQSNKNLSDFLSFMTTILKQDSKSFFQKLFPKISKGYVEVSKEPKLHLDLNWENNPDKVKFLDIIENAKSLFDKLEPGKGGLNFFIDELELGLSSKQRKRDIALIRDLIITANKLNSLFKKKSMNIFIYLAIRSEVFLIVESIGKEINKIYDDFGCPIVWHQSGYDAETHPLLQIVTRRIRSSLLKHGETIGLNADDEKNIWEYFFDNFIQQNHIKKFILQQTWYRPRDIVRLLNTARKQFPNEKKFSQHVFDQTKKEYSQQSWTEISEELIAKYTKEDIEGICYIFTDSNPIFTHEEFRERIKIKSELYQQIKNLTKNHKPETVLIDLYKLGIISNIIHYVDRYSKKRTKFRSAYRGDANPLLDKPFLIHQALKATFSIG